MQGTIDGFNYGAFTPVAAFLMACLGSALGLRCTTRSLRTGDTRKFGWLALGAAAIGSGIWTMHFIAMYGFQVEEAPISYDIPLTLLSLVVAIVMVGVGVFMVGYRGANRLTLLTAGTLTGLGVAAMHYIGMAGMRLHGRMEYDTVIVGVSIAIAVVAATAALWAAVSVHGLLPSLGASVVMGIAVTGMHYTGMAAISVQVQGAGSHHAPTAGGASTSVLFPMLIGPLVFLVLACVVVMFDPLLVSGEEGWNDGRSRPAASGRGAFDDAPPRSGRIPAQASGREDPWAGSTGTHR